MKINELDTVKITTNAYHSTDGIKKGRMGAVVEVYQDGVYEVEFVNKSGGTDALLTLKEDEVRLWKRNNL